MLHRIALFSDVHANLLALDAVLAQIAASGIGDVYCLGDLVGYGPDPSGVTRRMRETGIPSVRGNYDDGIGNRRGECGCYYATAEAKADGEASYAFTDARVSDDDCTWLASLPEAIALEVSGLRILLAHGSPRKLNEYLLPDRTDVQLARLAEQAGADVVCVGHVHIPYHRAVCGGDSALIHYVSAGSVGKPKDGDPRAAWVELVLGDEAAVRVAAPGDAAAGPVGQGDVWLGVVTHRVEYDIESVIRSMASAGLPASLGEALRRA